MDAVINKYQNGKIYTIRSPSTDKFYIGSTIENYLSNRLGGHKRVFKSFQNGNGNNVSSFQILQLNDAYIELLELYPCNSKAELHKREGELIREHKDKCVNMYIPGRTEAIYKDEYKERIHEYQVQYRKDHKDKKKETDKQYYINHKEQHSNSNKLYRLKHKEEAKEYHKEYELKHKEELTAYRRNYQKLYRERKKEKKIIQ